MTFDAYFASTCPYSHASTLQEIGKRIAAQAYEFAAWKIKREQVDKALAQRELFTEANHA